MSLHKLTSSDTLLAAADGKADGISVVNKFGRNIEIDSGVTADIWDGGYTVASGGTSLIWLAPTAARIHTIASDSTSDDTGSTGVDTVKVHYLADWDTAEAIETVGPGDLNEGIAMTNAAVMINRMEVVPQATTLVCNVGEITATAASDSTVTSIIKPLIGQTGQTCYGIPSTHNLYINRLYGNMNKAGGSSALVDVALCFNPNPDTQSVAFLTKHTFGLMSTGTSALTINYAVPKKMAGPGIVKIQALSGTNDVDLSAGFDGVLITQ